MPPSSSASAPVLTRRELNRATLARQLLLARTDRPLTATIEHLGGLQAQTTHSWYIGLWSRLHPYDPHELGRMLADREVVRIGLQRSTIHLVTADDALWMRPLLDAVLKKPLSSFQRNLTGVDQTAVVDAARPILEAQPLGWAELGRRLQADRWPDTDPASLAQIARARLALVQIPPRGVWRRSGQARHTTLESWLDRPLDADPATRAEREDRLVLRYLAAFGPATVMDAQAWCGVTRLAAVADRLRDDGRLQTFTDADGRTHLDLPDAPRPDPDTPVPVRFLYDYDNLMLSHADRSRFRGSGPVGEAFAGLAPQASPGAVLVDGVVRGAWLQRRDGTLTVRTAGLTRDQEDEVATEGEALLAFLTGADPGDGTERRVELTRC